MCVTKDHFKKWMSVKFVNEVNGNWHVRFGASFVEVSLYCYHSLTCLMLTQTTDLYAQVLSEMQEAMFVNVKLGITVMMKDDAKQYFHKLWLAEYDRTRV